MQIIKNEVDKNSISDLLDILKKYLKIDYNEEDKVLQCHIVTSIKSVESYLQKFIAQRDIICHWRCKKYLPYNVFKIIKINDSDDISGYKLEDNKIISENENETEIKIEYKSENKIIESEIKTAIVSIASSIYHYDDDIKGLFGTYDPVFSLIKQHKKYIM